MRRVVRGKKATGTELKPRVNPRKFWQGNQGAIWVAELRFVPITFLRYFSQLTPSHQCSLAHTITLWGGHGRSLKLNGLVFKVGRGPSHPRSLYMPKFPSMLDNSPEEKLSINVSTVLDPHASLRTIP